MDSASTSLPLFNTREAARELVRPTKGATYARILEYAEQCGSRGFTADEVAVEFGCSHNHTSPRIGELVRAGELIITGRRRPTRSGCLARVFVAKQFPPKRREDPLARAIPQALFPDCLGEHRDGG